MTSLPPIPQHLPAWQAQHVAWLASQGRPTRYAVPEGTEARRANLTDAELSVAILTGADLCRADLTGANLYGANLYGANLSGAYLTEAILTEAILTGANLTDADLYRANLRGAIGIASIGPIGRHGRIIYAVANDDGPRIQAGCWWGSVEDTIERIEDDYADDHDERDRYIAAVRAVAALVS